MCQELIRWFQAPQVRHPPQARRQQPVSRQQRPWGVRDHDVKVRDQSAVRAGPMGARVPVPAPMRRNLTEAVVGRRVGPRRRSRRGRRSSALKSRRGLSSNDRHKPQGLRSRLDLKSLLGRSRKFSVRPWRRGPHLPKWRHDLRWHRGPLRPLQWLGRRWLRVRKWRHDQRLPRVRLQQHVQFRNLRGNRRGGPGAKGRAQNPLESLA